MFNTSVMPSEVEKDPEIFITPGIRSAVENDRGTLITQVTQPGVEKNPGIFIGVQDDCGANITSENKDDFEDIWVEMAAALECVQGISENGWNDNQNKEMDGTCDHNIVLRDDVGYVCRSCGVIERSIESIIDVQFHKGRTVYAPSRVTKQGDSHSLVAVEVSQSHEKLLNVTLPPRFLKSMRAHQLDGFKFLCNNLVTEKPGGCIVAHAPGSGKTFMIISFIQSFLAKDPTARPLVVMPKGILPTWKREFLLWEIDIKVYDFYSVNAQSRVDQLNVLQKWMEEESVLFLGYKQFSSIICGDAGSNAASSCQQILLRRPSILILDEGHTPRNEDTNVLQSLVKVQTPCKVVLSGTLYQNHVKEVFNILNLVRPMFLQLDSSQAILRRIMSKVNLSQKKKYAKLDSYSHFYDAVEETLHMDDNNVGCLTSDMDSSFNRKVSVIKDLREMTGKILHYYKGDFLDELPGLVDLAVVLNLSSKQRSIVGKLDQFKRKFKKISVGSAVYLHPTLDFCSEDTVLTDEKAEKLVDNCDLKDGVKTIFFLNLLNFCTLAKEKLLVFSQFLAPLKFLERLTMRRKGWTLGREIFVISGESSIEKREQAMEQFNQSPSAKVFFGSIRACGEGISLVGASRIIILDVHLNPAVTRQAIGRAFRPGQVKQVFVYRLIAADSLEAKDHIICFKKEVIAKMWFEWNSHSDHKKFEMKEIDVENCGDSFFDSYSSKQDIRSVYRRCT